MVKAFISMILIFCFSLSFNTKYKKILLLLLKQMHKELSRFEILISFFFSLFPHSERNGIDFNRQVSTWRHFLWHHFLCCSSRESELHERVLYSSGWLTSVWWKTFLFALMRPVCFLICGRNWFTSNCWLNIFDPVSTSRHWRNSH